MREASDHRDNRAVIGEKQVFRFTVESLSTRGVDELHGKAGSGELLIVLIGYAVLFAVYVEQNVPT